MPPRLPASPTKATEALIKRGERHKEKFEDDADRTREVRGYVTVFGVNALSCCALALYFANIISGATELQCEAVFLVIKGTIEVLTGKFGWELLLHHTAMVGGFMFNQHSSMGCWAFVTVHQQLVHFPFALRALWRLTLPAFGYVRSEQSWLRRGLANLFWISWMFIIGYRTTMITCYCTYAYFALHMRWQVFVGMSMGLTLALLDRAWTKAMWPKVPWPNPRHNAWFHIGTRLWFALGMLYAFTMIFWDGNPEVLPTLVRDAFDRFHPSYFSTPIKVCYFQ